MKHGSNPRRGRNRGNGKRHPSVRGQTFESNGPDGKIRGTAQQVLDRYLALARDATSAGDHVTAEAFFQHAEHYFRILSAEPSNGGERRFDRDRRPPGAEAPAEGGNPAAPEAPAATEASGGPEAERFTF